MKKTIIFYTLFFITLLCFIGAFSFAKSFKSYILPPFNTMNVVIETNTDNTPQDKITVQKLDDIKVLLERDEGEYELIRPYKNILNATLRGEVKNLSILVKKGYENEIKGITVFNDIKVHYFKDFSEFKKSEAKLGQDENGLEFNKYSLPKSVKYNKNSNSYNYRHHLNTFCAFILSFFSFSIYYLIPYIFLFITIIYFLNNSDSIKKPPYYFILGCVFLISVLLRYNSLFDYLPWADEYYSIEYTNNQAPISSVFNDFGNPPVFYIISKIWFLIFNLSIYTVKILPFLTGVVSICTIWFFIKNYMGKKAALIGVILASLNIPLIYFSHELRSYILQAALTPLFMYIFFKLIEEKKNKYFISYAVMAGLLANIHYYEILFIFANFIYGIFALKDNKNNILKFIAANTIGLIMFLPFFLFVSFKNALLNSNFNAWIPKTDFNQIKTCVYYLFGGGISFILSLIFFVKSFKSDKNKITIYSFYIISSVIFMGIILSYLIRPMLVERYLVLLTPVFIIFITSIFISESGKKWILFCIIWLLLIQANSYEKNNGRKGVIEIPVSISNQYKTDKNIYVILNTFLEGQKTFAKYNKNAIYLSKTLSEVDGTINEILKKDKNAIIFTQLYSEKNPEKTPKNYTCFFNTSSDMCLWRIEND